MATEEKIVKIIDTDLHTRGASVDAVGTKGALLVKSAGATPTDDTQLNSSYTFTNVDNIVDHTVVITKTISGTSYSRTVSYNSNGEVLGITVWS